MINMFAICLIYVSHNSKCHTHLSLIECNVSTLGTSVTVAIQLNLRALVSALFVQGNQKKYIIDMEWVPYHLCLFSCLISVIRVCVRLIGC